jgi:ABC-type nickel/cobalt efflux system permease component RcnA
MGKDLTILVTAALSIGLLHTLVGPDHYLPFVVMGRVRRWSTTRTLLVTLLCGVGHVASSVVLGLVGIALGIAVSRLEAVEAARGGIATWLLIGFGLAYTLWGLKRAWRGSPHTHLHVHEDGSTHEHEHAHESTHAHLHETGKAPGITPWVLFTVFVLGPCEPLIPILMYPAAAHSVWGLLVVTAVFAAATIGTMLVVVRLALAGVRLLPVRQLERFSHALAGAAIAATGLAIRFLGL